MLLVSALLERGDLPALGRCLAASDRRLEWSVSEDLPVLVECLWSSAYLLDCDWSCVPGELCLDLFFVSSVLLALYTSATSGAFLFAESSCLVSLSRLGKPLDRSLLPLSEEED